MMNEQSMTVAPSAKPYPRRCAQCGAAEVRPTKVSHDAQLKHDGKLHVFFIPDLPVDQCAVCHEVYFTNLSADAKSWALREHLGLLQTDQIRDLLNQLKLTQRELARHLRVAEESVSRWVNGLSIQSRAMDTLMRLYFTSPDVRTTLASGNSLKIYSDKGELFTGLECSAVPVVMSEHE